MTIRKSSLRPAVIGVNFPTISKISATLETQGLRVKIFGTRLASSVAGFLPRCFEAKFSFPISN